MKFVQEKSIGYRIHSYADGEITLITPPLITATGQEDEVPRPTLQTYTQSLLLSSHELLTDWAPSSIELLQASHFDDVLSMQPEILILGTGSRQVFPPSQLLQAFYQQNIGIEVMDTAAACRTFNILVAEGRHIAAALIMT